MIRGFLFVCLWCLIFPRCLFLDAFYSYSNDLHSFILLLPLSLPSLKQWPQIPAPLMQASLFRLKWPVPPLQVPAQVDSSQWCHLNGTWFWWLYLLFPPSSHLVVDDPYASCISSVSCNSIYLSFFLYCMSATFHHVYSKIQPALCAVIPFTLVFDGSCLHDFSPSLCQ